MTHLQPLFPRQSVPSLAVATVGGEPWLGAQTPVYPGRVLPGFSLPRLRELSRRLGKKPGEFEKRSVEVVALSSDTQERAARSKKAWGLAQLTVGYGLGLEKAREWGLYISTSRGRTSAGVDEPALFSEPALS